MIEIKAPNNIPPFKGLSIFFGGTIDMGNSENWQKKLKEYLEKNRPSLNKGIILNPRRDDWDSSWIQHKNNPQFREQVEWELEAMERASLRIFVFLPNSKSPITMMELGAFKDKACIVYCPFEFYRSGNIHIFCEKYNIPYYTDWESFKTSL